jgi:hypothetical protein
MKELELRALARDAVAAAELVGEYKSETYLAVMISTLLRLASHAGPPETHESRKDEGRPGALASPEKTYAPSEHFATLRPETDIQKAVAAGYFLERYSGHPSFGLHDIRSCLVSAKVSLPKNLSLAILKAVQKGLMMELPGEEAKNKLWCLTQTGERFVDELLNRGKD